jgi:hypothetical protein
MAIRAEVAPENYWPLRTASHEAALRYEDWLTRHLIHGRAPLPTAAHNRNPENDTGSRKARRGFPVSFVHTIGCHSPCRRAGR